MSLSALTYTHSHTIIIRHYTISSTTQVRTVSVDRSSVSSNSNGKSAIIGMAGLNEKNHSGGVALGLGGLDHARTLESILNIMENLCESVDVSDFARNYGNFPVQGNQSNNNPIYNLNNNNGTIQSTGRKRSGSGASVTITPSAAGGISSPNAPPLSSIPSPLAEYGYG